MTAYRVRIIKIASGTALDESPEERAGAILDAEMSWNLEQLVKRGASES
jgi:hypothetical protein